MYIADFQSIIFYLFVCVVTHFFFSFPQRVGLCNLTATPLKICNDIQMGSIITSWYVGVIHYESYK